MELGTLALIGLGVSGAGTALSAVSQYRAGQAQEEAYKYNAGVAEQKGIYEETQSRDKLRKLLSSQKALYAKAGVDMTSGSPLLLMADTAAQGEMEALNIRKGYQSEAKMNRYYGNQAKKAGNIKAGSTFLSGLGSVGTQYASMKGAV